jgi:hypothetical protein
VGGKSFKRKNKRKRNRVWGGEKLKLPPKKKETEIR